MLYSGKILEEIIANLRIQGISNQFLEKELHKKNSAVISVLRRNWTGNVLFRKETCLEMND